MFFTTFLFDSGSTTECVFNCVEDVFEAKIIKLDFTDNTKRSSFVPQLQQNSFNPVLPEKIIFTPKNKEVLFDINLEKVVFTPTVYRASFEASDLVPNI